MITRGLYLDILLSLLKLTPLSLQDKATLGGHLQEVITECYSAIQSLSLTEQQLFTKDLTASQLSLLFWCSTNVDGLVVKDTPLNAAALLKVCLQDDRPIYVRTFCLEYVNKSDICDDVIAEKVLTLICAETDPDFLIEVGIYFCGSRDF